MLLQLSPSAIVTLVACCRAGIVVVVIVVIDVDVRHHRSHRSIPLLRRHRCQLRRPSPCAHTNHKPRCSVLVYRTLKMTVRKLAELGTGNGTTGIESSAGTGPSEWQYWKWHGPVP